MAKASISHARPASGAPDAGELSLVVLDGWSMLSVLLSCWCRGLGIAREPRLLVCDRRSFSHCPHPDARAPWAKGPFRRAEGPRAGILLSPLEPRTRRVGSAPVESRIGIRPDACRGPRAVMGMP
ncbi:hypothetical protein GCM10012280_66290 [Wenjunlia tyrosinilytica]|uniref:Uncharacterized protein n=1 Tax=Wenjunlia tyrosinilytica TaxID=1544741 RepID=A0A918E186_9ACTN|nr:hypothetical protein GCM10012280_66290 [Wenjunlia tyrosinilytica]